MNIESLNQFSGLCFILSAVFFLLAVVLFIVFRIPLVSGYLSGRAERRAIEAIRERNQDTGGESGALNGEIDMSRLNQKNQKNWTERLRELRSPASRLRETAASFIGSGEIGGRQTGSGFPLPPLPVGESAGRSGIEEGSGSAETELLYDPSRSSSGETALLSELAEEPSDSRSLPEEEKTERKERAEEKEEREEKKKEEKPKEEEKEKREEKQEEKREESYRVDVEMGSKTAKDLIR